MIRAIKSVSVQRGRDPRDFTLFAFGGSGPIHAAGIARELGIRRILVPPRPGVFSAVGLLLARLEGHAKRTWLRRTRDLDRAELDAQLETLERDARDALGPDILRESPFEFEMWAEMRYVGQGFELPVRLPAAERRPVGLACGAWTRRSKRNTSGRTAIGPGNPTEVVHLRVVSRESEPPAFPEGRRGARAAAGRPRSASRSSVIRRGAENAGPATGRSHVRPAPGTDRRRGLRRDDRRAARLHGPHGRRRQPVLEMQ